MLWVYKAFWHFFIMCGKKIFQLFQNTFPHMAKSEFGSLQNLRLNWNIKYINKSIIWNCSYQKITYSLQEISNNVIFSRIIIFLARLITYQSTNVSMLDLIFSSEDSAVVSRKSKYWWKPLFAYFLRPSKLNFLQSIDSS